MSKAALGCIPTTGPFALWKILGIIILNFSETTLIMMINIDINITHDISLFLLFSHRCLCGALLIGLVIKNWELIKIWMFLKFGIEFKDKFEMVENVADIDYDAFINYKCVVLNCLQTTKQKYNIHFIFSFRFFFF